MTRGRRTAPALALLVASLAASCAPSGEPPSIVWIVIDTVRADHLPFYGYERETAPRLGEVFARRGTLFERAYAQAPWTLPSAASYLSGLDPARLAVHDGAGPQGRRAPGITAAGSEVAGIPPGVATLAERLRARGYATGGFTANFLLAKHNGFARGFDEFWSAQGRESLHRHADSVQAPVLDWLRPLAASGRRPVFLYVHYLDPHDPYANPGMPGDRSPFDPDYRGPIGPRDAHRIYAGALVPDDPAAAARRLAALYDGEILWVDRFAAGLVEEARRRLGKNTLFVLSSDHGEELHEHGGWKHGQTLYEEQLRVPLLFRWDGRIEAGRRIAGEVRLLDVVPTLLAAAGAPADPGLDGVDLLPALLDRGREPPRRPVFASHWNFGRRRSAVIADGRKTILYDRRQPFATEQPLRQRLEAIDFDRLERVERYDLAADPGERASLATPDAAAAAAEAGLLDALVRGLDPAFDGLRVLARRLGPGERIEATIRFEQAPDGARPLFLGEEDRLEVDGAAVRLALVGDGIPKGITVTGGGGIVAIERGSGGTPILLGAGEPYREGAVDPARLALDGAPPAASAPELRLWTRASGPRPSASAADDAETERRLRALGYLQ